MRFLFLFSLALAGLPAAGCSVSGGRAPDGSQWFFASVMENTAEEVRTVDDRGMMEGKIGKDQTTGAKVIQRGVLMSRGIEAAADTLAARIARDRAVQEAAIGAGSELDLLRETNRSAEALRAAEIAAEAGGGGP